MGLFGSQLLALILTNYCFGSDLHASCENTCEFNRLMPQIV